MKRNPLLRQSNPILKPSPYTREINHIEQLIHKPNPILKHSTDLTQEDRKFVKRWYELFELGKQKTPTAVAAPEPAATPPATTTATTASAPPATPAASPETVDVEDTKHVDSDNETTTSDNTHLPAPSVELPHTPKQQIKQKTKHPHTAPAKTLNKYLDNLISELEKMLPESEPEKPISRPVPDEDDDESNEDEQKQLKISHDTILIRSDLLPLFTNYQQELDKIYKDNPIEKEEKLTKHYVYLDKDISQLGGDDIKIKSINMLRPTNKKTVEDNLFGATNKKLFLTIDLPPKTDKAYEGRANQLKKYITNFADKLRKQPASKQQEYMDLNAVRYNLLRANPVKSSLLSALAAAKAKKTS